MSGHLRDGPEEATSQEPGHKTPRTFGRNRNGTATERYRNFVLIELLKCSQFWREPFSICIHSFTILRRAPKEDFRKTLDFEIRTRANLGSWNEHEWTDRTNNIQNAAMSDSTLPWEVLVDIFQCQLGNAGSKSNRSENRGRSMLMPEWWESNHVNLQVIKYD